MNRGYFPENQDQAILFPALEQSMMAVILTDENDVVRFFNPAAGRLWGYERDEVQGHNVNMLVPVALRKHHPSFIQHNREGGQNTVVGMNRELQLQRKDGSLVWGSFVLSKADVNGRVHYLAIARDVTAEVQRQEQNRQLLQAMAHTDQPVLVLSPDLNIVQVNRAFTEMFGYHASEATGCTPDSLLFSGDDGDDCQRFKALFQRDSRTVDELQIVTRSGENLWVRVCATPVSNERGQSGNRVLTFTDETENQTIRTLEKDILLMLAGDYSFSAAGKTLCRKAESLLPGIRVTLYHRKRDILQLWAGSGRSSDEGWCLTWPIRHNDNEQAGLLVLTFSGGSNCNRFTERVAESCTWFSSLALEQESRRQQIEQLQQFDTLTGLPARLRLHQCIDRLISEQSDTMAVFCLGVDNFSRVNDMLGYADADRLLLTVSERLRGLVGPEQYLSRTEGAQFVIVAPGYDADDASRFARELKNMMNEPVSRGEGISAISLTVSTGISLWHCSREGRDFLLAAARNAMERIRDEGGNGWLFFDPGVNQQMKEEQLLGVALKKALADEGLTLHYQPQVNADSGELYGVEALARWSDPVFGSVSPLRFVAMVEKTGETGTLARWVLKEACRQMAEWRQHGTRVRSVSVNLSPGNFQEAELPAFISGLLDEYTLPGECLTIEVTENAMMDLSEDMVARLNVIREIGVGLSVDDFGTGFSGLQNLAKLPVTEIKIDKSFIDDMTSEERARALTEAMIGIGHSLGLTIVAEGVETQAQLDVLRQLRCTVIQGYLFSPPLPPQQLEGWIHKRGK